MGKHDPLGDIKAGDSQLRADAQAHHKPISKISAYLLHDHMHRTNM